MRKSLIAICCSSLITVSTAAELIVPKFTKPDFKVLDLLAAKEKTSFKAANQVFRSNSASVFARALPSVVKVLTNEGHGSGVVASTQGFIITNYHVVAEYETVGVVFSTDIDSDEVNLATVVRFDEVADLALLRLNRDVPGLVAIKTASGEVNIGDDVHAIGHPLGEDWTYTRGYVSQKRQNYAWQTGVAEHHVANVIQTQTPINPGNSGGPLLNDDGEMIGINSFGNADAQGLNFAIDLSSVNSFLKSQESRPRKVAESELGDLVASWDDNKNGDPDAYGWDSNGNSSMDILGYDFNEDLAMEELHFDENEDGNAELKVLDGSYLEPSTLGIVYVIDENEDGEPDAIAHDEDGDGEIDYVDQG